MTSFTPRRPRRVSERKNWLQKVSASNGLTAIPSTSRTPSVLTATAIFTAFAATRTASRDFTQVASIHRYGQSPSIGRIRNALTRSSISPHNRLT